MGITNFRIIFNQPGAVFYPGQVVAGVVTLSLNKPKSIRGVELKLKGRAKCKWHESESYTDGEGKTQHRQVTREQSEKYFKNEIVLNGGKGKFELPIGDYSYPFSMTLPQNIPSTFSGEHGGIQYSAKAKVDIPWETDNTTKEFFIVRNLLNCNNFPNYKNPFKTEKHKTFCCLCCASGPLTIAVHVPKTGFGKLEAIPVTLEVDNASNVKVHDVHAEIKREITFKAHSHQKHVKKNLKKQSFGGVDENKSNTWSEEVQIPSNEDYPNIENCSIIKIKYELEIEADAEGIHSDLEIKIPIIIGDIPFGESEPAFIPPNQYPPAQQYSNPPPVGVYPGAPGVAPGIPMGAPGIHPGVPPYPNSGASPYPNAGAAPYPNGGAPVYPNTGAPYPNTGAPPYPNPGASPYPNPGTLPNLGFGAPSAPSPNPEYLQAPVNPACAGENPENATQFTPLLPVNPSAPPPN